MELHFSNSGTTHNTLLGGFVSLIVQLCFVIYFGLHVEKLIHYKDDKITTVTSKLRSEQMQEVKAKDMKFKYIFTM